MNIIKNLFGGAMLLIIAIIVIFSGYEMREASKEAETQKTEESATKVSSGDKGEIAYHTKLFIPPVGQPHLTWWEDDEYWIDGKKTIKHQDRIYPITPNVRGYLPAGTKAISYVSEICYDHVTVVGYCNWQETFSVVLQYADGKYGVQFYSITDLRNQ